MMKKYVKVIILFQLLWVSLLPAQVFGKQLLDYIVAVVNNDAIVYSDLEEEIRNAKIKLEQQKIAIPNTVDLEKQVLEGMIYKILQLQMARQTGITVDDNTLNDTLRAIAKDNSMDLVTFRQKLQQDNYSYEKFREDIRDEMAITRLKQRQIVNRISVTEREIDNFIKNLGQQGNTGTEYLVLHILIATPEAATPEQIEAKRKKAEEVLEKLNLGADFMQTAVSLSDSPTALEGGSLGWRKVSQLPSLFVESVNSMKIGEIKGPLHNSSGFHLIKLAEKRDIQQTIVTQTEARHVLIKTSELMSDEEAEDRLAKLKYRIEQGDDFAKLAKANSEDPVSAAQGGSLGWINPGDMVQEFEEVMNELAENQISQPFKSRYGWHIVQVLGRRQHDDTDRAIRAKATQYIRQRKIEEELQTWLRQLRDEAYIEYASEIKN